MTAACWKTGLASHWPTRLELQKGFNTRSRCWVCQGRVSKLQTPDPRANWAIPSHKGTSQIWRVGGWLLENPLFGRGGAQRRRSRSDGVGSSWPHPPRSPRLLPLPGDLVRRFVSRRTAALEGLGPRLLFERKIQVEKSVGHTSCWLDPAKALIELTLVD